MNSNLRKIFICLFTITATLIADIDPSINLNTRGFWYGLLDFKDLEGTDEYITDHGRMHGEFDLSINLNKDCFILPSLDFSNYSLSYREYFSLRTKLLLNLGNLSSEKKFKYNIRLGSIDDITLGAGLTLKDFNQVGGELALLFKDYQFKFMLLAQGYTVDGDMIITNLSHKKFPLGINLLLMTGAHVDGDKYEEASEILYVLPYLKYNIKNFNFYIEGGIKKPWDNTNKKYNVHGAIMAGVSFCDTLKGFIIKANPEFRFYEDEFILKNYISNKVGELSNYYNSTNNWIDFQNSKQKSLWYYFYVSVETPKLKGFSFYLDNEFLYYKSDQKYGWSGTEYYSVITNHDLSSNYYHLGIKYSIYGKAFLKIYVTNKTLNEDPFGNGVNYPAYSQYGTRFVSTEGPVLGIMGQWDFNLKKSFKKECID